MSNFHVSELIKIERATSGFFRGRARSIISMHLIELVPKVKAIKDMQGEERNKALNDILKHATAMRHIALQRGANGYSHPEWAAASACESWLLTLRDGNEGDISSVEAIIARMINRR